MKNIMIKLYKDYTQNKNPFDKNINNAHYFFRKLNIRTCPYCNRHYTFTLSKKNTKVSPEYDHFYDKSSHPLLADRIENAQKNETKESGMPIAAWSLVSKEIAAQVSVPFFWSFDDYGKRIEISNDEYAVWVNDYVKNHYMP